MSSENRLNLANLPPTAVEAWLLKEGESRFRVQQLLRWIWREGVNDFEAMTNLSKPFRSRLSECAVIEFPEIVAQENSSDGTIKYLLKLRDGKTVETVWIPRLDTGRVTVCVSTQVGCKMGCTFCLTAQQKVERNLTAGEIAGQLRVLPNRDQITNVVFMGMGEPLDNYTEVMGAINIMTHVDAFNMGPRKITVSTSGLVPAMKRFLKETKVKLAVSLNAANDKTRSEIMPVNRAYDLDELLGSLKEIARNPELRAEKRDFNITFEYILMDGVNDSEKDAEDLVKRVRGIPCKINLLLYNENPNVPYRRPQPERVDAFRKVLGHYGLLNFIRTSRGRDISAACGQLASIHKRQNAPAPIQISL
jgi:23S rRNA (adenine2503-C2)-methyltransferase